MWFPPAPAPAASTTDPTTRYCVACDCSQFAALGEPCWYCGEELTTVKPMCWPSSFWTSQSSAQTVRSGNSFSVSELDSDEESAA